MSNPPVSTKLAAVFYADIAGYCRLTRRDEVKTHREVMAVLDFATAAIAGGGGLVLRYAGDAILAQFDSAVAAATTAIEIQQELSARNSETDDEEKVQIRVGLNVGEVIQDRGEIFGDGVNLAARLEASAVPGGICISSFVRDQIADKIDVTFVDGGDEKFKNIGHPVRVYRWHPQEGQLSGPSSVPPVESRESIAVLPLDNLSSDPEQEFFADGITEDIITELSREKDLFVIARNSTAGYKGQSPDIRQVAKDLQVKYVLEGSIRRAGNMIRLNAQLIEGETNAHIWAERYDRPLEDIFEVQDDLTNSVINTLLSKIQQTRFDRAFQKPAVAAYDHYVRAFGHLLRLNRDDIKKALAEAKQAIEIDPAFARGHMVFAWANLYTSWSGWTDDLTAPVEAARNSALKAIACDKDDFWGHGALAFVELFAQDYERALSSIREAIRLSPNSADSRAMHAVILNLVGKPQTALEEISLAVRHNPHHPHWYLLGFGRALFLLGRYEESVPYLERLVNAGEDISIWRPILVAAYMALGREREARDQVSAATDDFPNLGIAEIRKRTPMKDQSVLEHYVELLRQAGMPE